MFIFPKIIHVLNIMFRTSKIYVSLREFVVCLTCCFRLDGRDLNEDNQ